MWELDFTLRTSEPSPPPPPPPPLQPVSQPVSQPVKELVEHVVVPEETHTKDWFLDPEEPERKRLRSLILNEDSPPVDVVSTPMAIVACPPMAEVDEVDESQFIPQPLPPLPSQSVGPHNEGRDKPPVPYEQRPVVQPKPVDPSNPWKNAGLMRDIGGVDGYMKVKRGTHRYPDNS